MADSKASLDAKTPIDQASEISKSVELKSGVVLGHWKIYNVNIDVTNQNIQIGIAGYLDQAAFDAGKEAERSQNLEFDFTGITTMDALLQELAGIAIGKMVA